MSELGFDASLTAAALAEAKELIEGITVEADGATMRDGEHIHASVLSVLEADGHVNLFVACVAVGHLPVDWSTVRVGFRALEGGDSGGCGEVVGLTLPLDRRGQATVGPLPAGTYQAHVYRRAGTKAQHTLPADGKREPARPATTQRGALRTRGGAIRTRGAASATLSDSTVTTFSGEDGALKFTVSRKVDALELSLQSDRQELDGQGIEILVTETGSDKVLNRCTVTIGRTAALCVLSPPPTARYEIVYRLLPR